MPLTSQQFADELLRHWHLLWPLPPAERIKKIDEIKLDLEYQDTLCAVTGAMWEPQPRTIDKPDDTVPARPRRAPQGRRIVAAAHCEG